jgi:hypothetical protein
MTGIFAHARGRVHGKNNVNSGVARRAQHDPGLAVLAEWS